MMITLNLISRAQRDRIRASWAAAELASMSISTIFVVILATGSLYGARHLLATTRDIFSDNLSSTAAAADVAEADVQTAKAIADALEGNVDWRSFLAAVAAAVPPGVQLERVSVDGGGNVGISGHAPTRDSLLQLQRQLESSGAVADLYSPVRNLLQPADISFELSARLATSTDR